MEHLTYSCVNVKSNVGDIKEEMSICSECILREIRSRGTAKIKEARETRFLMKYLFQIRGSTLF